jgi:hypothetical protein
LGTTILAASLSLALAGHRIDSRISFHGRTLRQALRPIQGALHTAQAIPENLVFGNLGLGVQTTPAQGVVLTLGLVLLWTRRLWKMPAPWKAADETPVPNRRASGSRPPISPLECAGAALLVGTYLVEWSFRGYESFENLRTLNLRFIVPWYDAIPQFGAVLLLAGWWSAVRNPTLGRGLPSKASNLTWLGGLGLLALVAGLLVLGRPRVEALVRATVPSMVPSEREFFLTPRLKNIRANAIISSGAEWQRARLRGLDKAEAIARRMGFSRDALHAALGHPRLTGSVGALRPELYDLYDAIGLLDLPEHGRAVDPAAVRSLLAQYFVEDTGPRPDWILPTEVWPPPADAGSEK